MSARTIGVFFMFSLSSAAFADCESKLNGRILIRNITETLVAEIRRPNINSTLVARSILETLTHLEPKQLSWNEQAYNLVRRLHSIQRWRPVIERVTWFGHDYREHRLTFSHLIVNSFWGRPLNLHDQDWAFFALFQFASRSESRLSMALGPYLNARELQSNLERDLNQLLPTVSMETQQINVDGREFSYLIIRGIPQLPDGLEFAERLVSRLQDRR